MSARTGTIDEELKRLRRENRELLRLREDLSRYLRAKIDQLLVTMGSKPLDTTGLDDRALLELDPIGTVSDAFAQIRSHLHAVNDKLRAEIAHRKRVEETLRQEEERFRTLAEFSSSWVFWRGPSGEMVYVSPAAEQITGYTAADFYACPDLVRRVVHPDDRARWEAHCHEADASGMAAPIEFRILTKDGEERWISHLCRPVYNERGEFLGVRGSNRDVTNRKRAEEALRRSEERLRDLIDNASDMIQSVSPDGRFLHVNRAWRETLGYTQEEVCSLTLFDIVAPESRRHCEEVFARVMAGEEVGSVEAVFLAKDGRRVLVEGHINCRFEDGRPAASRSIFRDVTERKRLEEHLLKARKLESLGVLAGGIAHDFNNFLTAILGNISLCLALAEPGSDLERRLAEAQSASLRAKELARRLLTFAKGGAPLREPAGTAELVCEAATLAVRGSNVRCEFDVAPGCLPLLVDREQVGQAVANVVRNAVEAMPEGGVVTVRAANADLEGERLPGLKPGRYVRISVEDRGVGIPREQLPLIFDPFFSTKEGGTGLGLATAFSIVNAHQGVITVDSEPGEGTCVRIYLPAAEATPACRERPAPAQATRRILVMDDEEMVRDVAADMLSVLGYRAEVVRDGAEVLESWRRACGAGEPFDAVIMDLTVPGGMGGKEAVRRLLAEYPGARAIVSSGYSEDPIMSDFARHGFRGVIAKPYTLADLRKVLETVLSS